MDTGSRARLALHGILVIVLGLLVGFPFVFVVTGDLAGEVRAWRMAHLEGLLNGTLMLAVAAAGSLLSLTAGQVRVLVGSLLVAGYGNVVAATIGAIFGVRGLLPSGPVSNFVVFALFAAAIVGVFVALGLAIAGASRRAREAAGR